MPSPGPPHYIVRPKPVIALPMQKHPDRLLPLLPVCLCFLFAGPVQKTAASDAALIRIGYVGGRDHSAFLGVTQGMEEASLQGRFLGQSYRLEVIENRSPDAADLAPFVAVVAALSAAELPALARLRPDLPVFNVTADDDALRAACTANLLHVLPSAAMKRDAVKQWLVREPEAGVTAAAWHPAFEKFAARDLNKRFRAAFDRPMDDYAWAGWAAVKMSTDMIARTGAASGGELLRNLRGQLAFDGQKGVDMDFRPTGQLRQPLLLVGADGTLLGEAPVRGVAPSDDALDSLGLVECAR